MVRAVPLWLERHLSVMPAHSIMLFDLLSGGHHGQYVRQLVEFWGRSEYRGRVDVVVPNVFLERHTDVQRSAEAYSNVRIVPIDEPVVFDARYLLQSSRMHGRLLRKYLVLLRPDHCLLMYFDHVQLALALGLRFQYSVKISGIYFRPSFHYGSFDRPHPRPKDRLQAVRKRVLLWAALRNPHFRFLFCLDPYVVPFVQAKHAQAVALPDGVARRSNPQKGTDFRSLWGVKPRRRVAVFFGTISVRKGIYRLLEAAELLPSEIAMLLCLVISGRVPGREKARLAASIQRLERESDVQVVLRDQFVEEDVIQAILESSDLVLLPYLRHIGSSGVLVRAALAGVPVMGSNYGLLGEHLRQRKLGLTVNTTSAKTLAEGLETWLRKPRDIPFDAREAARFARENTADAFSNTIFSRMTESA